MQKYSSSKNTLSHDSKTYSFIDFNALDDKEKVKKLPFSIRILLENLLRHADNKSVTEGDIDALINWDPKAAEKQEIAFFPARVVLQDFTGVPSVADLAAMRDAMDDLGGNPDDINPKVPAELVIDHSVMVDYFGGADSFEKNTKVEMERNRERYQFLRWGQQAFDDFKVVPPGTGIVHQVNLEYLARVAFTRNIDGKDWIYPDTLVGTDSHTTMINGLGVLGWGVGGIEAEAAMLGQPISMLIPEVVGFRLTGALKEGTTATDLVLTVTQMLRKHGVVGKFVEFYGPGLASLSISDRATIANMSPEFGATCGIFPFDHKTVEYLRLTGRDESEIERTSNYMHRAGFWHDDDSADAEYSSKLELHLDEVTPSIAGPKRPQDLIDLRVAASSFKKLLQDESTQSDTSASVEYKGQSFNLAQGAVVIAAITSCTNTSNPSVLLAAGLVARNAVKRGLKVPAWVKTSLAPGSKVVTDYLEKAGLLDDLEALGFYLVGYGCTTCIGNSGPLPEPIDQAIRDKDLTVASVLSGNRNFEGRIHSLVKANYLASPPLIVAYALAGNMKCDLYKDPLGQDKDGKDVYLKDIWPSSSEILEMIKTSVEPKMFRERYADVYTGTKEWKELDIPEQSRYSWPESSYVKQPPFFHKMPKDVPEVKAIENANVLVMAGDSITTDHISPAGAIDPDSPAGQYLQEHGIEVKDFNSYGSRRGNHEVMVRGTFANVRFKNLLAKGKEGGWTKHIPSGEIMTIFDASKKYQEQGTPLIVLGGKEYGTGSSRDWAAKGPLLLGVKAVIAQSYERIHRSNLVGMGILPLQFKEGDSAESLNLSGDESFSIPAVGKGQSEVDVRMERKDGSSERFTATVRIDAPQEYAYYENNGILNYVLRQGINTA